MIAVGDRYWWWNRCLGAWELMTVERVPVDSPVVVLRSAGRTQLGRAECIESGEGYAAYVDRPPGGVFTLTIDLTAPRQEVLPCAV